MPTPRHPSILLKINNAGHILHLSFPLSPFPSFPPSLSLSLPVAVSPSHSLFLSLSPFLFFSLSHHRCLSLWLVRPASRKCGRAQSVPHSVSIIEIVVSSMVSMVITDYYINVVNGSTGLTKLDLSSFSLTLGVLACLPCHVNMLEISNLISIDFWNMQCGLCLALAIWCKVCLSLLRWLDSLNDSSILVLRKCIWLFAVTRPSYLGLRA